MRISRVTGCVAVLCIAGVMVINAGCGRDDGSSPSPGDARGDAPKSRLQVVASLHPLADVAKQVGGDAVTVQTLLPPGVTPHGFTPTPLAMVALGEADVLLLAGRGVDAWARDMAQRVAPNVKIVTVSHVAEAAGVVDASHRRQSEDEHEGHNAHDDHGHDHAHDDHDAHDHAQDAHDHDHFGPNPHLWLDPLVIDAFAGELAEAFAGMLIDEQAARVRQNAQAFRADVTALHEQHRDRLGTLERRRLITFHNAFDPLADRYGLQVVAHLTPLDLGGGAEVTPARLDAAVRAIESYDVPAVYVEPQFSDAAARRIAERSGVPVLTLDPLGHPDIDGRRTWLELMQTNLNTLMTGQTAPRSGP